MRELAARYLNGAATEAEVARLSELLRADQGAREEYLRLADVHARLAADTSLWTHERPRNQTVPRWKGWLLPFAAAAAVLLMAALFWPAEKAAPPPVATLLRAEDAVWAGGSPNEGGRLNAGPLRLSAGRALLRLDGGAILLLRGAVDARLESGGSVALLAGEIHAQVPEAAAGFTLRAPGGDVVDLGTEFVTRVSHESMAEVTVVKGEVEVRPRQGSAQRLTTGKALAMERDGSVRATAARLPVRAWEDWEIKPAAQRREGALLVHDAFEYPPGSHDPAALNGGAGWGGPWSLLTDSQGARIYSGASRTMETGAFGNAGAWLAPAGKNLRQRRLAQPLGLAQDAVRYASLAWFEESLPTGRRKPSASPASGLSLTFRSLEDAAPGCVGLRVDHLLRPRIETGMGQGFVSRVRATEGRRLLLVAKILSRREGEDEIMLRVFDADDPPGAWEPEEWDIRTRGLRLDAVLDHVILQSSGPSPRRIEEVRLASAWLDAVAGWSAELTNDE